MEIFELISACGCFFEVMVLVVDAIAGVSTVRYVKPTSRSSIPPNSETG